MRTAPLAVGLLLLAACKQGGPPAVGPPDPPVRIDMRGNWKVDEATVDLDQPCAFMAPHPEILTSRFEIVAHPTLAGRFALASFLFPEPLPGCGLTSIEATRNEGDGVRLDFVAPPMVGFPECPPRLFAISMTAVGPDALTGIYSNSFGPGGLFFTFHATRDVVR